jgi:hypothetical protein
MHWLRPLLAVLVLAAPARAGEPEPSVVSFSPATFTAAKQRFAAHDPALQPAFDALLKDADRALNTKPASVMEKAEFPPGIDPHDYVSYAPYFWPNPDTKDGLPYVRHDGKRNREQMAKGDHDRLGRTISAIGTLGLAYGLSEREDYADRAVQLLRVWFLDPQTRMNPNFAHAQIVLGLNTGRGTGLIDFAGLPQFLDGLSLLRHSPALTADDRQKMDAWLTDYAHWLATSKEAADERNAANNHGSWFDLHEVSLLVYLGKTDEAKAICERAKQRRIARQIEPDGSQPLELARADGWGYSVFNVNALTSLAVLADRLGVDLWHYQTPDGRSLRNALDYLAPYTDPAHKWPGNQANAFNASGLAAPLLRARAAYGPDAFADSLKHLPPDDLARLRVRLTINPSI